MFLTKGNIFQFFLKEIFYNINWAQALGVPHLYYFELQEEEAAMTRYQEEMLTRVRELHEIARGAAIINN